MDAAVNAAPGDLFGAGLEGGELALHVPDIVTACREPNFIEAEVVFQDRRGGAADTRMTRDIFGMRWCDEQWLPGDVWLGD